MFLKKHKSRKKDTKSKKLNVSYLVVAAILILSLIQFDSIFDILGQSVGEIFVPKKVLSQVEPGKDTVKSEFKEVEPQEAKAFVPTRLVIKKVSLDLKIVSVPLKNGTWEVFEKVANYAQGTSLVNKKDGNVGIYGHDTMDALHKIKDLRSGDKIVLLAGDARATYQVVSTSVVAPTDISVFYPTAKPFVTLVTCDGFLSQSRYSVSASLLSIESENNAKIN